MRIPRALLLFLCAGILGLPTRARAQDVQQLKDRLNKLEQEITELRGQIGALEQTQSAPPPSTSPAAPPSAQEQVPMEGEEKYPAKSLDIYGFVMLDSGYQFNTNDPNWFDVVRPTKLPSFAGEFAPKGKVWYGVRQTRFGVKSSTPTAVGTLNALFEFELFGTGVNAGQTTFRLRHAYGELGQFGAGQTWSAFMDIDVFPNSLEYWGPNGMVFFRNVQLRWMPIRGDSHLTIALEGPGASADQGVYSDRVELQGVKPHFKWPDLAGNARVARKWGYLQVGGIVRSIAWVDTSGGPLNLTGHAVGWGWNISSNVNVTKKDVGKFSVVYGRGIENYMNDAPVDIGVKHNPTNPITPVVGVALPVVGVVAFLDHNWNQRFSTSTGYSFVNISNSNAQLPSAFHQGDYALTNLLYHPIPPVTIGGEFQFGRRVNFSDGFNVNDDRLQFSFKYDWSKGYEY